MKKEQIIKALMDHGYDDSLTKVVKNVEVNRFDFELRESIPVLEDQKIQYSFYGDIITRAKWNGKTWVRQDMNDVKDITIEDGTIIFNGTQCPSKKAIELGATLSGGINWDWAEKFSPENAEIFIKWLDDRGFDHRGIYSQDDGTKSIRYR